MPKREGSGRKKGISKEQLEARVNVVMELIIRGFSAAKVTELLEQNEKARGTDKYRPDLDWNIKPRAVKDYYRKAHGKLQSLSMMSVEMELALAKSRYEDLYQRALAKGALGVAARALRDKTELLTLKRFVVDSTPNPGSSGDTKPDEGNPEIATTQFKLADGTIISI